MMMIMESVAHMSTEHERHRANPSKPVIRLVSDAFFMEGESCVRSG